MHRYIKLHIKCFEILFALAVNLKLTECLIKILDAKSLNFFLLLNSNFEFMYGTYMYDIEKNF